jgi:hypothetical protein|eukprot:COSAG01_NODE_6829_length_3482_cov_1.330772_4_plen_124_part_00
MDLAKLGWRHIDPRLMHRVAVPLLKTWCASTRAHARARTPEFERVTGGRQAHYPETMHKAYILNAPRIFALIWKIIRPVLAERVVARIVIATDSREEELRALLRYGKPATVRMSCSMLSSPLR